MRTYTMAELSRSAKAICESDEPSIITSNGHPQNLVFNITDLPVDEAIAMARDIYGRYCVRRLRAVAQEQGTSRLTDAQIEEQIAAVRATNAGRS